MLISFHWVNSQEWNVWVIWQIYFLISKNSPNCLPWWWWHSHHQCFRHPCPPPPQLHRSLLLFLFFNSWMTCNPTRVRWNSLVVFICIFLMPSYREHLFMYLLISCILFCEKMPVHVLSSFLDWIVYFFFFIVEWSFLHILDINCLLDGIV